MSRPIVIAVDPGKTSGFAILDPDSDPIVVRSFEHPDWLRMIDEVSNLLAQYKDTGRRVHVVCERFIISARTIEKSRQSEPLDAIGALKYLTYVYDVPFTLQTPSEAKTFSTNDKLKNAGFWHKGGKGHANDALRHGMLYMVRQNWLDLKTLM